MYVATYFLPYKWPYYVICYHHLFSLDTNFELLISVRDGYLQKILISNPAHIALFLNVITCGQFIILILHYL